MIAGPDVLGRDRYQLTSKRGLKHHDKFHVSRLRCYPRLLDGDIEVDDDVYYEVDKIVDCRPRSDVVGEKKAISRGIFGYNGPCGSLGGHCAVQKSIIYIYSIYILLPPLPVPKTGPKWTYSLLEPAFRCAPPVDYCSASSTRWAPWILVRSRRSYAPLGLPAALGLR